MLRAWRAHDFRAVFLLAGRRGLTADIIAGNTGLPLDLVINVVKGSIVLGFSSGVAESIAWGFGMPDEIRGLLGLAPRRQSPAGIAARQSSENTGKRDRGRKAAESGSARNPGDADSGKQSHLRVHAHDGESESDFHAELVRFMTARGIGVRELARRTHYTAGYISNVCNAKKNPSLEAVEIIDRALDAGGKLTGLMRTPANSGSSPVRVGGALIRAERRERGWPVRKMAEMLCGATDNPDDLPPVYALVRMIRGWEAGQHRPSEMYRLLYCRVFGMAEDVLFGSDSANSSSSSVISQIKARSGLDEIPRTTNGISSIRHASPAIAELCDALTDYGFDPGRFGSSQNDGISSLGNLERDLKIAFNSYQQSRFTTAASRVSMLLADAQLAAQECRAAERSRVLSVLALSYQAAASVLTKVGESDLAWIAAERGFNAAKAADSPSVRGSLIRSVAFALLSTGRLEPAMRLVESGAGYLQAEISGDDTALSVYGTLFLAGSMAAARFGDGSKTAEYLQEANSAARRLGKDANHLWTAFGPTNVAIHRVNTAVELGDIQTVLDYGLSLNTDAVPVERRVRYLLDVARAYGMTGNRDDALGTMLTAERIAPEQVRQHHLSRKIVVALIRSSTGKPAIELEKLATRVNVREPA
ncbi:MAG TPA: helix-turn-helix transcriptional regulator [Streptosporangiaceae bacterium]